MGLSGELDMLWMAWRSQEEEGCSDSCLFPSLCPFPRLRALSSGGSVASPPPSPAMPKYKLADYRYGREEMLALYVKENKVGAGGCGVCGPVAWAWSEPVESVPEQVGSRLSRPDRQVPAELQDKEFAMLLHEEPLQPLALEPLTEEEQVGLGQGGAGRALGLPHAESA